MVPSLDSSAVPCFPECLNWVLDNQLPDGSWGLPHYDPLLTKDVLSSTLASVITLKRWGVGEEQINKGLWFIELNYASITDEKQHTPIGFCIIFPGMIEYAIDMDLGLPLSSAEVQAMLQRRDMELRSSFNLGNKDFLKLAVEDFYTCQSMHQKELKCLERWIADNRLDKLKFPRQKLAYCYFSAAANLLSPEVSDARISWAKSSVLTTVVDDFFDVGGSEEELVNLIQLVEKWDVNVSDDCCSEQVEVVFSALYSTINDIREKAYAWQGRSVTDHIIEIWQDLMKSMMKENERSRNKSVPMMDEYMSSAYVSFVMGTIVLPALYFVGSMLSEEVVESHEYRELFKVLSTWGRFMNDIRTVRGKQRKEK